MKLELQQHEVLLLMQILREYISNLRMEISNTEQYEMRESLKQEEGRIKGILARLEDISPVRPRTGP